MRFEVLGPLDVRDEASPGRRSLLPSATKKRVVLGALLSRVEDVVPTASLITEIWGEEHPRKARAALHVYMAQLRTHLAEGGGSATICTEGPGYVLRLGDAELDHFAFRDRCAAARRAMARHDPEVAADELSTALEMWRGPALAGLTDGPMLGVYATCLNEERIAAVELRLEIDLRLGRHRQVVSELIRLVHDHPLRESFCRQLMLAYYRSERRADALNAFLALRHRLNEELGVEPCRSVQQLHRAVLTADPDIDLRGASVSA